jgi:hypothetical protein
MVQGGQHASPTTLKKAAQLTCSMVISAACRLLDSSKLCICEFSCRHRASRSVMSGMPIEAGGCPAVMCDAVRWRA